MAPILAHSFCGNYPDMAIRALADLRLSAALGARREIDVSRSATETS
jgi:hypothetical protein